MQVDFVINCCHGGYGENGGLSAVFENAGIPCSCGDSYAMAVSMDKCFSKHICKAVRIPVVKYFEMSKNDFLLNKDFYLQKPLRLKYPLVVKPARQGSSIGVCLVKNEGELLNAVRFAFLYDDKIIVEKAVVKLLL